LANKLTASASIFHVNDIFLRHMADTRFPDDCSERTVLLKAAETSGQLWALHWHLTRVHKYLGQLDAIDQAHDSDDAQLAPSVEKIPQTLFKPKWQKQFVGQAPAALDTWTQVHGVLRELMQISEEFRFLGKRPEGSA
jgi:hypothetical protein